MSIFDRITAAFTAKPYNLKLFKSLHHSEFMFVRELDLISRDEFCKSIDGLVSNGWEDWKKIELVHENHYAMETRWRDGDEVVTRVNLKKDGLLWRSMVSRIPYQERH